MLCISTKKWRNNLLKVIRRNLPAGRLEVIIVKTTGHYHQKGFFDKPLTMESTTGYPK